MGWMRSQHWSSKGGGKYCIKASTLLRAQRLHNRTAKPGSPRHRSTNLEDMNSWWFSKVERVVWLGYPKWIRQKITKLSVRGGFYCHILGVSLQHLLGLSDESYEWEPKTGSLGKEFGRRSLVSRLLSITICRTVSWPTVTENMVCLKSTVCIRWQWCLRAEFNSGGPGIVAECYKTTKAINLWSLPLIGANVILELPLSSYS